MQTNPSTSTIAIANPAAGGNRILADGLGPSVLSRIDRDVLGQSGVKYAMVFEGVNDIGVAANDAATQTVIGDRIIAAYQQIISRIHARGIPMFAATITPFGQAGVVNSTLQPYSDPEREKTRQKVNKWIRESETFDAVVDFDAMLADPQNPVQLDPMYNSGDFLHPNDLGYMKIADEFPLGIFEEFEGGVGGFI